MAEVTTDDLLREIGSLTMQLYAEKRDHARTRAELEAALARLAERDGALEGGGDE